MLFGKKNMNDDDGVISGSSSAGLLPGSGIFDVTTQDFEAKVIQASMEVPIVVDMWSPSCGPCTQLTPILENVVRAAAGKVLLAKVNLDQNQELAQALRVQSLPTVFGFVKGQPVDAFMGLQPESQVRAFVNKLISAANGSAEGALDIPEALSGAAGALAQQDFTAAHAIYSQILQQDIQNVPAYVGLVRTFIAAGQPDKAQELIEGAPDEIAKAPLFAEAKTALELAMATPTGSIDKLAAKLAKDPDDYQACFDLAVAEFSQGRREDAISNLLEILRRDKEWNEQAARKQLLKFFEAMGAADPLTLSSRKKFSAILFS